MSTIAEKLTTIAENEQKIYDKGAEDANTSFWKHITANGSRRCYTSVFSYADYTGVTVPDTFKVTQSSPQMFSNYRGLELPKGIDLSNVPKTGNTTSTAYLLYTSLLKVTEIYDMKLPAQAYLTQTFYNSSTVVTIEKVRCIQRTIFTNTFMFCDNLKNITFEGVIGRDISFQFSPLSVASMKNIISCLADYSTTNTGKYTVTFTDTCWASLEASGTPFDDGLTDDKTLTWKNYVISLGWNV